MTATETTTTAEELTEAITHARRYALPSHFAGREADRAQNAGHRHTHRLWRLAASLMDSTPAEHPISEDDAAWFLHHEGL